jgi:hypothetical protein
VAVAKIEIQGAEPLENIIAEISGGTAEAHESIGVHEDQALTRANRKDPYFRERLRAIRFTDPEQLPALYQQSVKTNLTDSERKIYLRLFSQLSGLAKERDVDPEKLKGKLYLYTERHPCTGCIENTYEFSKKFPGVDIVVFYRESYF